MKNIIKFLNEEKKDEIEDIIKLDLITFLFINISLCVFDDETLRKNNEL